ncbi:MAG: phytanoyl-CoA dioxygenase family protein [Planctomycetota bacterium]|nr:phytanoyl-CoA dioxygenase family protein [Planctomycetota bacterium]MDA1211679.1 phytanoyl-CoA dioxygenase family protein [Planctomycetota bacterium]
MSAPKFSMIPTKEELDRLTRRLEFHPCTNEHPQTLTTEQIAHFNREGYLKDIRIFSEDEIADIRRYFDRLLADVLAKGGDSYSISTAHMKHGRVYDLLMHPQIVTCVTDLLGDNVIGWGSHFFCKMPGDGKSVSWHQDASYWPLSPSKTVTVWLAIDDADVENACMNYIPGTHLYGHLTYELSEEDDRNVLDQKVPDIERFGAPIPVELKAGEMAIHNDLLLHGSKANESTRRRCGLTLRYCAADVRAGLDWNLKGVIVSGSDPTGHWGNPRRPDVE